MHACSWQLKKKNYWIKCFIKYLNALTTTHNMSILNIQFFCILSRQNVAICYRMKTCFFGIIHCLFVSLSVCLFICLPVYLFVCLSDCLFCQFVCLSVYLFACLSVCLFVCFSVSLFVCVSDCLIVCLSVCLFVPVRGMHYRRASYH